MDGTQTCQYRTNCPGVQDRSESSFSSRSLSRNRLLGEKGVPSGETLKASDELYSEETNEKVIPPPAKHYRRGF